MKHVFLWRELGLLGFWVLRGFLRWGVTGNTRLWFTTGTWLSRSLCLSAISLVNMIPYLHRQDLTLEVERELRTTLTDAPSPVAPYLLSSHPVHNHLGIAVLSFHQHSRSQHERREHQHFSSVKSRTTGKGWSKPVVWNFSLCENLWRACYNASQWVPLQGFYSTEGQ